MADCSVCEFEFSFPSSTSTYLNLCTAGLLFLERHILLTSPGLWQELHVFPLVIKQLFAKWFDCPHLVQKVAELGLEKFLPRPYFLSFLS